VPRGQARREGVALRAASHGAWVGRGLARVLGDAAGARAPDTGRVPHGLAHVRLRRPCNYLHRYTTRTAICALRAQLVPAVVLSGVTTPEQLNTARRQLSAGIVAAAAAAEEAQREAAVVAVAAAAVAAAVVAAAAVAAAAAAAAAVPEVEPGPEAEPEAELAQKPVLDSASVLALMVKAMERAKASAPSPVMEMDEPETPMERQQRSARARLFVVMEGGVQSGDTKVFDRGRHTHTHIG
jgi:hypothetical protein